MSYFANSLHVVAIVASAEVVAVAVVASAEVVVVVVVPAAVM